ncbi:hypothetical protein M2480_002378 [Parabacteroides sp. PFB2-12]|uniref:NVEALA domain-containing protein n=1 Tax=unclassified Parabacteroides TaxID=2649774 RepID=UPI0024743761|nr:MULTISPECIES: NVEALA domain-containing protein [unclassified Parabacteroides]MDH6343636.1 hypothetical protein [Parabacteroides sp. PM6-13]MDH6391383.1 hypothetical protein [Parabacteroides sp. PFB2-12]
MKKKIVSLVMVAAIAVAAGWGIYLNEKDVSMSDLALANIEALATPEGPESWDKGYKTGKITVEGIEIPCCVPASDTDACNFTEIGCIRL